jgi:DNA-binding MarR family transcriptional regulator
MSQMTEAMTYDNRDAQADWRLRFVEDMGGLTLISGLPRAVMRVLGWMIVSEPREQTAGDIQTELNLSAGSVSAAVRELCDVGMLERIARPGDRRIHYRLSARGWAAGFESRFRILGELRRVAGRALDGAGGKADERLQWMHDLFAVMEAAIVEALQNSVAKLQALEASEGTTSLRRDG